jgi:hypothetical protein
MNGRRRVATMIDRLPTDVQAGDFWPVLIDDSDGVRPMNVTEPSNLTGGVWRVAAPMSYGFAIGTLTKHTVREEEDGSISVRPGDGSSNSILITGHHGEQYHGFIEKGVWT